MGGDACDEDRLGSRIVHVREVNTEVNVSGNCELAQDFSEPQRGAACVDHNDGVVLLADTIALRRSSQPIEPARITKLLKRTLETEVRFY